MNKKIMLIGSLVLILAMGLVISGCKNEETEDLGDRFNGTSEVGSARFVQDPDSDATHNVWVITWSAADDAAGYAIVFQQTAPLEKKTIELISGDATMELIAPQNGLVYAPTATGNYYDSGTANDDVDQWSAVVKLNAITLKAATKGKIGVLSVPLTGRDKNNAVAWSEEKIVTADQ